MSIPYIQVNSVSYTHSLGLNGVFTINSSFGNLRGGGSVSITGLTTSVFYYSITSSSYGTMSRTYSVSVATGSNYNVTFSFYKGPYYNYPQVQPSRIGITLSGTAGSNYGPNVKYNGGVPYNTGIATFSAISTLYEVNRSYPYSFIINR